MGPMPTSRVTANLRWEIYHSRLRTGHNAAKTITRILSERPPPVVGFGLICSLGTELQYGPLVGLQVWAVGSFDYKGKKINHLSSSFRHHFAGIDSPLAVSIGIRVEIHCHGH